MVTLDSKTVLVPLETVSVDLLELGESFSSLKQKFPRKFRFREKLKFYLKKKCYQIFWSTSEAFIDQIDRVSVDLLGIGKSLPLLGSIETDQNM